MEELSKDIENLLNDKITMEQFRERIKNVPATEEVIAFNKKFDELSEKATQGEITAEVFIAEIKPYFHALQL